MADGRQQTTVERWLGAAGTIAAPITAVSALLFYFGYVSARAQYDYFGLDVDTVGLSTQAYVMRSPQPLLVPLLVLIVLGALLTAGHRSLRRRIMADGGLVAWVRGAVRVGIVLIAVSFGLLFAYPWLGSWPLYGLVTPLVLASGAAMTAYGLQVVRSVARTTTAPTDGEKLPAETGASYVVLLWVTVAASVFWATATVAQWSGRGLAKAQARDLTTLPSVILDTRQPLALPSGTSVRSRPLTPDTSDGAGLQFRHQYFHLRLLIQGDDRLFVVPDVWNNRDTTLVVPLDGTVRVQFQFRNDPP